MSRQEIVIRMMEAIAPIIASKGLELQQRLIDLNSDPENCTIGGKDIPHAYAETARVWAEALADEAMSIQQ